MDKTKRPYLLLTIGSVAVIIGYSLLGPAPYLSFLGKNVYFVAFGLVIQGIGVSATFISTLVFMMSESVAQGAPDTEQTRGMITSLWYFENHLFFVQYLPARLFFLCSFVKVHLINSLLLPKLAQMRKQNMYGFPRFFKGGTPHLLPFFGILLLFSISLFRLFLFDNIVAFITLSFLV